MMKPKIVLLIFVSGKIVLTGAKVREEIYQAFERKYYGRVIWSAHANQCTVIYPVLSDFRKS
jgi:hypothetical protein